MKNKLIIILILTLGFILSAYYFSYFLIDNSISLEGFLRFSSNSGFILLSILLLLLAFYIRSLNSYLLIRVIREARVSTLFRALSIGFFCNSILPFRIGEFVRAHILGKELSVSRTVMFFTILIERMVDCIALSIFFVLLIVLSAKAGITLHPSIYMLAVMVFSVGLFILIFLYAFYSQSRWLLKSIYVSTSLFNDRLRDKTRHIMWSATYGTNVIVKHAKLGRYFACSLLMWCVYLASVTVLTEAVFGAGFIKSFITANTSYLSVSVPSGSGFVGTFHYYFTTIVSGFIDTGRAGDGTIELFSVLVWSIFIVPVSIIGCAAFLFYRKKHRGTEDMPYSDPRLNKLYRETDISAELSHFLDEYFSCNKVSGIINRYEIEGSRKLIKIFRGGSNASTLLLSDDAGNRFVKKITLVQYTEKLRNQYLWLLERQGGSHFPRLIGETRDESSYSYDTEYMEGSKPFFEQIHSNPIESGKETLDRVLAFVEEAVYTGDEWVNSETDLHEYIEIKILDKVKHTSGIDAAVENLLPYDTLVINGKEVDNLLVVLDKIRSDEAIMAGLARYRRTPIHGDLTIDNIQVPNGGGFVLLDPNDENFISDPIVDIAKLYQSLHSGYEFLCTLTKCSVERNRILFDENISSKFTELFNHLDGRLARELPPERHRAILFHEAVHYCRMLTYRARINPDTLPAFYAIATRLFNEFYEASKDR